MTQFIESLRRLYNTDKIQKEKLDTLLASKKITQQDYNYILTGKEV